MTCVKALDLETLTWKPVLKHGCLLTFRAASHSSCQLLLILPLPPSPEARLASSHIAATLSLTSQEGGGLQALPWQQGEAEQVHESEETTGRDSIPHPKESRVSGMDGAMRMYTFCLVLREEWMFPRKTSYIYHTKKLQRVKMSH